MASEWKEKGGGDDFDDEGLPLLRKHTQVRVTGNNRTKSSLVGLTGVVKKAVGLGGWHWLKLSNGHECRLQRNALAVVALPTGEEIDSSEDEDDPPPLQSGGSSGSDQKASVPAPHGNGGGRAAPRRPTRTPAAHRNEADTLGFAFSTGKRSERSRAAKNTPGVGVNFDKLERSTLEKISKTHYEDESLPDDPRKSKLVEHIADHFVKEKCPDENEVLLAFIKALAGSVPKSDKDPANEEETR